MLKKISAVVLAVCMILLTFGCGKGTDDDTRSTRKSVSAEGGRIAIVIGAQDQQPEIFATATELAKTYDDSVMLLRFAEDFHTDSTAVTTVAQSVAANPNVKAILFADGVNGTGAAVKAVREARDDICIIVCNPHEGSVEMHGADLILSVDFPALGQAMVAQAKKMGAENFVFYTTNRHLRYSSVVALRRAAELACEDEGLTFKAASSVDLYESGRTLDTAKQYLAEDVPRKFDTFGEKTALVCTEPQVQGALAAQAIDRGMFMPATFLPSPLALADDLGVDLTGHETDSAYAMEQLRQESVGAAGHVATWGFSVYVAFLHAAFDYAIDVLNGSGTETTVDGVQTLLAQYTDGTAVTVTTDANGAYLVQSALVVL